MSKGVNSESDFLVFYIYDLPFDIRKKIFLNYFQSEFRYKKIEKILSMPESIALDYRYLTKHIPDILASKTMINYLQKRDNIFPKIYEKSVINGEKNFVLLNPDQSFALTWLMYLYH